MAEYGSFSATGSGNGRHGQRKSEVFDQQTLADAQLLFKLVDTDSDGRLDANELTNNLSDMGVPSHDIDGLFYNLDANGDGQVLSHTRNRDLTLQLPAPCFEITQFHVRHSETQPSVLVLKCIPHLARTICVVL